MSLIAVAGLLFLATGVLAVVPGVASDVGGGAASASLLCAGTTDRHTAIQFTRIWSDTHQATVGGQVPDGGDTRVAKPPTKSVVASVKLPIVFSPADRRKFEAAVWRPVADSADQGSAYSLENAGRPDQGVASSSRGMLCVVGAGGETRR